MSVPEVLEGLDELVVLEPLEPEPGRTPGARVFLAWDPRLEREVQLWLLERAPESERSERIRRWGAHDSPGLVPLHGRGDLPTGEWFLVLAHERGAPLRDYLQSTASVERRRRVLAALARTIASLEHEGLAWPDLSLHVRVDAEDRPVLDAVCLDRDAVPGEGLPALRSLAEAVPLGAALARALAAADDLAALARALDPRPPGARIGLRVALIGLIAASAGLAAAWWWGRDLRPFPDGACSLAEARASAWLETGPALEGVADERLRARVDGWAHLARESCEGGRAERLSVALVRGRGHCLQEQLAALAGVRVALAGHRGSSEDEIDAALAVAGPGDACAWGPEEGYLLRTRADRRVPEDLIAGATELGARAILGESPEQLAPAPELADALPPRWAAQLAAVEARRAADDPVWRRFSWERFTLSVQAGDDLAALDALIDRASADRGAPVVAETARRLALAWSRRLPSHLGDSPRVEGWLASRRDRLAELGGEAE